MAPTFADICKEFERRTGAPPLSKVADVLNTKLPDEKQLRLFIDLLDRLERLAKIAPDIDKVLALATGLNGISMEMLKTLNTTLRSIERIIDKTPQELTKFLPLATGLNGISMEMLKTLNTTLQSIERIIDKTPQELTNFLATLQLK